MDQSDVPRAHRDAQATGDCDLRRTGHELTNKFSCGQEESLVEVDLVLTNWQMLELDKAASQLGMTSGQLLRRLILIYLGRLD